jgi:hypothetical protein
MKERNARNWFVISAAIAALAFPGVTEAQQRPRSDEGAGSGGDGHPGLVGPLYHAGQAVRPFHRHQRRPGIDSIRDWNEIAMNATGLDHTPVAPGENRVAGEQFGPCRASRAMAIIHVAMFDVVNAVVGGYEGYTSLPPARNRTSVNAAVAQAAHDTLSALFPSQKPIFDAELADDLSALRNDPGKADGIALGRREAELILALRSNDGSQFADPLMGSEFITSNDPGKWRQDPISMWPTAIGAYWGSVKPFVLRKGSQFRIPAPPALNSAAYATAFDEVRRLGGDGITTPTERTEEQTFIGIFWAYDGTPSLCAPPRMYNQIVVLIAGQMHASDVELARLLALANLAMGDAAITSWDSKFFYQFWRPITGIREADTDGNPLTTKDPTFTPLGAPASNLAGPNFTPPFPACPSGHATFGGAVFQLLRRFYKTDRFAFTFISDEFNGSTRDNQGNLRPLRPRSFTSFSQAEEENAQSRIYLGIHWSFDKDEGIALGRKVGDYVFEHALRELRNPQRR